MTPADLFVETRLLVQLLKPWLDELHDGVGITGPMRGVMEVVLRSGALSVPAIARGMAVSRQHVQVQVDALLAADLVAPRPNPAHKRSPLIALTDKGRAMMENMRAEELRAFARLQTGVSDEALVEAGQVLAACRAALVSGRS